MKALTYEEKDAKRTFIEWDGFNCIMIGTISEAGILRRCDGCIVSRFNGMEIREPSEERALEHAMTGKWLFDI